MKNDLSLYLFSLVTTEYDGLFSPNVFSKLTFKNVFLYPHDVILSAES
jgi:hypothetical protein